MEPCADMDCRLKVDVKCESCMMKTIEVLRSIRGVYSVTWDAEEKVFRISGEVDPNILLKAVLRTGEHAELLNVKLNHPQLRLKNNYNYGYLPSYPYGDGGRFFPYNYETNNNYNNNSQFHHYLPRRIEYPSSSSYYYDYESPLPRATYVPSYPPQECDPNDNYEGINFCTIM